MFNLKNALTALCVLASLTSVDAANRLNRRRCRAVPNNNGSGGAINVGGNPHTATATTVSAIPSATRRPPSSNDDDDGEEHPGTGGPSRPSNGSTSVTGCFPRRGFNMPNSPNGIDLDDWWCSRNSEYAFLGFSYDVTTCPSKQSMISSFRQMKNDYNARYVRVYSACDRPNFYSDVVDAGWEAGVGVWALVWFGFANPNAWRGRLDDLMDAVNSNPRAPYIIRNIAFGSEPLFDNAVSAGELINNVNSIRNRVRSKGIQVATSEMAYKLNQNHNVLEAIDNVQLNLLPFFGQRATTGGNARDSVLGDFNNMADATGHGKKICATQTGWPSNERVWKANTGSAVASVASEKAYYDLLDDLCPTFKNGPEGGFAWFAHLWEDSTLPGWGIVENGRPKFDFSARTQC